MLEYKAAASMFGISPYFFFAVLGMVFSSSLFILLLLKYGYSIRRYTRIYFCSGLGLLFGAKLFGVLTGVYSALANREAITLHTFLNTGIVFYGGLLGYVTAFIFICKIWHKGVEPGAVDLMAVSIPLFHAVARVGCFFAGCCYGTETTSRFAVRYSTYIGAEVNTAMRIPVQLVESGINAVIFTVLMVLLFRGEYKGKLLMAYLLMYAVTRISTELLRGDAARGIWRGVSFSQLISAVIIITVSITLFYSKIAREREYETRK